MPDLPRFGVAGSPTIDLTGQTFDVGGFDPARLADMQASIDRLASPTPEGTDSGAGRPAPPGRPGPEPSHADGRVVQRPGQGAQDPTVADALAFDDIVGHPDNRALGDQIRGANQGAINDVDQAAKTDPSRAAASQEGTWTAQALFDGPQGRGPESAGNRQPVMVGGGRPDDTLDASAARNVPASSPVHARADGIDAPGNDRSFGNEVADNRSDRGAQMGDRNPTIRNQDGNGSGTSDLDTSGRRDTTHPREDGHAQRDTDSRRDESVPRRTDQDEGSSKGSSHEGGDTRVSRSHPNADSRDHGKEGTNPSASGKDSADTKDSDPVSVPKDRFDAQDKAHGLLRDMDLGSGRDFRKNFVDLVNSKQYGPLLERAFYNTNGHRYRADIEVNGEPIPTLVRAGDKDPWLSRDDLLPPKPPSYLFGTATGTRVGLSSTVLRKLDISAAMRKASLIAHKPLDKRVQTLKEKLKNNKSQMTREQIEKYQRKIDVARAVRSPMAAMKTRLTESFGEKAARRGVLDNFTGKPITLEEVKRDKHGRILKGEDGNPIVESREVTLPKLAESTAENPNPIPTSENAPKGGNSQFDQIWRTDLGDGKIGYVIVEAKSSQDTRFYDIEKRRT